MLFTALLYIFFAVILIQLAYFAVFSKFSLYPPKKIPLKNVPVSIVICARNESANLNENLRYILEQTYKTFEVIVVDDASTDNSLEVLYKLLEHHPKLKIVSIESSPEYQGDKKIAITKGIAAASYEHLLFTDADCKPVSSKWISTMTAHFNETKKIILAYGAYQKIKKSFLNKLIRYETLLSATQFFSYAKMGLPYMGVGRNLGYTKSVFLENKGLSTHMQVRSGDDDLLINAVATKRNTTCCYTKESFTLSSPKKTLGTWFTQKRRHITTSHYYKPIHQFILGSFYLSQLLFWVLAIILLFSSFKGQVVVILILIRFILQYYILGNSASKLNEKDLIIWLPVLDLSLVLVQLLIFISNLLSKPKSW